MGDIDGDGVLDLAVGAHYDGDGGTQAGSVYVLFLETSGSVKNARKLSAFHGNIDAFYVVETADYFGVSVAVLGDLDGDGVGDTAVGAYYDDDGLGNIGAVYMLFHETNGNVKDANKISALHGNLNTFYALEAGIRFGISATTLGDADGGGVVDLAVGADFDHYGGSYTGAVYVIFLETNANAKSAQKISFVYGNLNAFYTIDTNDRLGRSLAVLGDIDGGRWCR